MKIDMRTTTPTMQEVVEFGAMLAMGFAFMLKDDTDQADELLTKLSDALDFQASREHAPRLRAMLSGAADFLHDGDEPRPVRRPNQHSR